MEFKDINVSDLLLDPNNARHGKLAKQSDILAWMLNDSSRRAKLFKLGEDIAVVGLNPLTMFAVVQAADKKLFTVIEGNRRTAALQLLMEPGRAMPDQLAEKRFSALAAQGKGVIPVSVRCAIFDDTASAQHWIDVIHLGEQGGIGTVTWGPIAKARSNLQLGKDDDNAFSVTLWDNAVETGFADPELEPKLNITNLQRVLDNEGFCKKFGDLSLKNGLIYSYLSKAQYEEFVSELIEQITSVHVKDIYSEAEINQFQNDLAKEISFTKPKNQRKTKHASPTTPVPPKKPPPKPKKKPVRKRIVESGFPTSITSDKLQRAFIELSGISSRTYPLAASAVFRMVLEYSVIDYLKANGITPGKNVRKLAQKCGLAIEHMKTSGSLDVSTAKAMDEHCRKELGVVNVTTLNCYIHHPNYTPTQDALFAGWDDMKPLFEILLHQK